MAGRMRDRNLNILERRRSGQNFAAIGKLYWNLVRSSSGSNINPLRGPAPREDEGGGPATASRFSRGRLRPNAFDGVSLRKS